jgi:6-phosphofructokinase 2
MKSIVTLTLNPAIDGASEAQKVGPTHKIRTWNDRYNPGGGGINVARVVKRLGGNAKAVYLAGGATGDVMDSLLDRDAIDRRRIDIEGHMRISLNVHEQDSGLEYRFVPEGPVISLAEAQACRDVMRTISCDYLVLSGSLPRGVPEIFYSDLAAMATSCGARVLLDSSGPALKRTLENGHVFLAKPSRGELEKLTGKKLPAITDIVDAARNLVTANSCYNVAVTLGHEGALLVKDKGTFMLPALPVNASSAVGAGDSFVGGMVFALASGESIENAFRMGLATATATVLSPGTDLCQKADVERVLRQIPILTSTPTIP